MGFYGVLWGILGSWKVFWGVLWDILGPMGHFGSYAVFWGPGSFFGVSYGE